MESMNQLLTYGIAVSAGLAVIALIVGIKLNSRKAIREQELSSLIDSIVESEIAVERKSNNLPNPKSWFGYWYNLSIGAGRVSTDPYRPGYIVLGVMLLLFAVGFLGYPGDLGSGLILAAASVVGYRAILKMQSTKRIRIMDRQLPNFLSGMQANLQAANMTPQKALLSVIDETPAPLGKELETIRDDLELSVPLDTALARVAQRIPSGELRFFIAAMRTAISSGSDLAPLIGTIQGIVVKRTATANKLATAVSEVQPTIIISAVAIPAAFAFSWFSEPSNQSYWLSVIGIITLVVVAGLYAISLFISKKQVDKVKEA